MCLHILEGEHCRLFHHIAEVTRQREFGTFTLAQTCLDEENLTADTRPCQSGDHAGIGVALIDVAVVRRFAQQVFDVLRGDFLIRHHLVAGISEGNLSQYLTYLFLQLSHAALTGVLFDDLYYCWFSE